MSNEEDKKFVDEMIEKSKNSISQYDDYGDYDFEKKCWKNCSNHLTISESTLTGMLRTIEGHSFAILTAYKGDFSKEENIRRNRKLRAILNSHKMGVHQLVGHYPEIQKDGTKKKVVERSYFIRKPDDLSDKDFTSFIIECLEIDGEVQNTALISLKSRDNNFYLVDSERNIMKIGSKLSLEKIGDMYSQHVKKMNIPFVFEGVEIPQSMCDAYGYRANGFDWL